MNKTTVTMYKAPSNLSYCFKFELKDGDEVIKVHEFEITSFEL